MQPAKLLVELRRVLPAMDAQLVLTALSEDELVWKSLQDEKFLQTVLTEDSCLPSSWSPARLALRPMDSRVNFSELAAGHLPAIENSVRRQALETLENILRTGEPVSTLEQAGLVALALRERRRKTQTWRGLLGELESVPVKNQADLIKVWQTPLACLYGMIPDKWDFLEALLPVDAMQPAVAWISHIILCDPGNPETQARLFHDLISRLAVEYRVEWLRYLSGKGRFALATSIADRLLISGRDFLESLEENFNPEDADWATVSRKILDNQLAATLYQISGRPLQAGGYLEATRSLLKRWLAGSTLQLASVKEREGQVDESLYNECIELVNKASASDRLRHEVLFLAGTSLPDKPAKASASLGSSSLGHIFRIASLISESGISESSEKLQELVARWLAEVDGMPELLTGRFVCDLNPLPLLNVLTANGLEVEALQIAEKFLPFRSEDVKLLEWLADHCHRLGEDGKAIDFRLRLILLQPESLDQARKLASLYEDRQEWAAAIEERRRVLQVGQPTTVDDLLALASDNISAGEFKGACDILENILEENPDHGMAYTLLGKARLATGEVDAAIDRLSKAVALIPENSAPWLELAAAYKRKDDPQKVIETLREAVLTAPDSAELHYSLGKVYLDNNQISDALPFLRQSAQLAPGSVAIARSLAEALITLGYRGEALEVVEQARKRWRRDPNLAYLHAKMLLKDGKEKEGLEILEIALAAENPLPEWFLLAAQILCGDHEAYLNGGNSPVAPDRLARAQEYLQQAIALQPNLFEAHLLSAEVHLLQGEPRAAFETYRKLIEYPDAVQDETFWRVQAGLGRSALQIGQTETALASLQNAVTANPSAPGLLRILAEAFLVADLIESAVDTAGQALSTAPEDVENLSWYAGIMLRAHQSDRAIDALRTALEINPGSIDLRLRLVEILFARGDLADAQTELNGLTENPSSDSVQLRSAAHIYLRMNEDQKAIEVLEKAVLKATQPDAQLLFELAVLYSNAGRLDQSLETVQRALKIDPGRVDCLIFQATLQEKLKRPQAALALLQQALTLSANEAEMPAVSELDTLSLFQVACSPVDIHVQLSSLQQKLGNLEEALEHAEKAIELQPEQAEVRFRGAELATRMLLPDRALKILESDPFSVSRNSEPEGPTEPDPWRAALYALRVEHALECSDLQAATRLLEEGFAYDPQNLRLRAAQIILKTRTGAWVEAEEAFHRLWSEVNPDLKARTIRSAQEASRISTPDGTMLAIAEAAVALFRWQEASQILEYILRRQPAQPLALLRRIRMLVQAAEWYFTGSRIGSVAHLPDEYVTGEDAYKAFTQTLAELKRQSSSFEYERWKIRGEAVFHPSAGTIRAFATRSLSAEDAAAMVMALNRIGNYDGARQVGEQYQIHPLVCVQMALIDADDLDACQRAAEKAVELLPTHPVCHAVLGVCADRNGDVNRALEAMETALAYWPDESGWQYLAAKLALKSNEITAARIHLENTHALLPANLDVMLELGGLYMNLRENARAVELLQEAVQVAPSSAEAWLALAKAFRFNQQVDEALKAAEQAARHGTEQSYKALVLSGEILLEKGDDKKALEFARQAEKLAPMQPETRLLSCKILAARGKEKEALNELNRAIEDMPGVTELELERARLVHHLHGATAALQVLEPMVVQNSDQAQLLGVYASLLAEADRPAEAEKVALQALHINPNRTETHLLLGRLFAASGQLDKAVHHLSESATLDRNNIDAYLELGTVYASRREYDQALASYQQAMNIAPNDYRPYYQAGLILRDSKDYQAAETMLRRAAALAPSDVNIRRQLGAIVALNLVQNCQEANSCL